MKEISFCLIGFGNVAQAFARLILRKEDELREKHGVAFRMTAIATGRHGRAIDPDGLDLEKALKLAEAGQSLDSLSKVKAPAKNADFIQASGADFMLENSPVNYETGEPAISHIRAALENDMHVASANKGPVVHAYHELKALAAEHGHRYLFESAVMDGAPIFSVFREALPATNLFAVEGIFNSCTNLLIELMEEGNSFDEAVTYAQSIGIAETDPSGDIDGWDAAIKVAAVVTVLMDTPFKPQQVQREGIRDLSQTEIQQAKKEGNRWKLVCRAEKTDKGITASVAPEMVSPQSPLYSVSGTSSFALFKTDTLPGLGILEGNPSPDTTAYGLLADVLNILKTE
ncbi:MAG: homoserine dehydrogenase [Chloroflexota bacterium]|nr:homoserine dehydrogenase [Chloroflexota bacterium]